VEVKELVQQQRDEVEEAQCPVLCTDEVPLNSSEFAAQVQADWSGEQLEIVGSPFRIHYYNLFVQKPKCVPRATKYLLVHA
jgi:hypothetical protein